MTFEATDFCKHDGFLFFRWSELLNNSSSIAASGQWQIEVANMLFNAVIRGTHATVIKLEAFFQLYPSSLCLLNCCTGGYGEVSHEHRSRTELVDI